MPSVAIAWMPPMSDVVDATGFGKTVAVNRLCRHGSRAATDGMIATGMDRAAIEYARGAMIAAINGRRAATVVAGRNGTTSVRACGPLMNASMIGVALIDMNTQETMADEIRATTSAAAD
jgi:hypothetical protein